MRSRSSVFLRALLCLLLSTVPELCGVSASYNTTNGTASTPERTENVTDRESPKTSTPSTTSSTTTAQTRTTIESTSSGAQVPVKTTVQPTTISPLTSSYGVGVALCPILFICFLILFFFCAYKWYIRNGRPSFTETRRRLTECVRNAWVAAGLRPPSKDEEEEEEDEEEAGKEVEEEKNQGQYAEDVGSDSDSSDYSNMEGFTVSKKTEGNEGDDDLSSVELKDEKTEREKDDLTVL
ncbi:uncharacterized protein LOC113650020 [Tachysurus fulvidraco]|uniref:uncharacterized protein LOC113650020 n=1 Tax=Tachysurus fulvidraco TaxID=1234273 RepID=UPI001FEF95B7|nr:uncharacterized protein LOC113650020 [Tachysurus fulvidraco]